MQARWGTHGDHPIIVLAAATTRECFDLTVTAFNLSEKYRTPVILLTDEVVAHTREKVVLPEPAALEVVDRVRPTVPPEWYVPYADTASGVPPMGIFGDGYRYHVTGLIHDVHGFPTERRRRDRAVHEPALPQDHPALRRYPHGRRGADRGRRNPGGGLRLGGPVGPAGRPEARDQGIKAGLLQLVTLWPFPRRLLTPLLRQVRAVLVPELNMGQMSREVKRVNQGLTRIETLNRIDGQLDYAGGDFGAVGEVIRTISDASWETPWHDS